MLKNKIDFTCSVQLITTRSMKAATVAPNKDECAICLMSETTVITQTFVCGCVVKAHSTCLNQWFSKPDSNCVYCRKPTAIRPSTVIESPLISRRIDVSPARPVSANIPRGRRLTPPPMSSPPAPRTYIKSNSSRYTTTQFMVLVTIKIVLITIVTLLIVLV